MNPPRLLGFVIVIPVFIIGGLIVIPLLEMGDRKKKKVTAVVTKITRIPSFWGGGCRFEYEYVTESGQKHQGKGRDLTDVPVDQESGQQVVTVYYDPEHPESSMCQASRFVFLADFAIWTVIAGFAVMLLAAVYFSVSKSV